MWRYTILYVTERCYESGGRVWDQVFNNVCWCLFICISFTGGRLTLAHLQQQAPHQAGLAACHYCMHASK